MGNNLGLVFTNSGDQTADYLCQRLDEASIAFIRLDTDTSLLNVEITYTTDSFSLLWRGQEIFPDLVDFIVFRRPRPVDVGDDADQDFRSHSNHEWAESLEGFLAHIPKEKWINHPANNFNASHKLEQLSRAKSFGLHIPASLATTRFSQAQAFISEHDEVIVKPLASGFIDRGSELPLIIYTNKFDPNKHQLFDKENRLPVLFQELIKKLIDVRIVVLDGSIVAVGLIRKDTSGRQILDVRRDNMVGVEYSSVRPPSDVEDSICQLVQSYQLRFAAIDFCVAEDGNWYFLEINPNGQWAWLDIIGGFNLGGMFVDKLGNDTVHREDR